MRSSKKKKKVQPPRTSNNLIRRCIFLQRRHFHFVTGGHLFYWQFFLTFFSFAPTKCSKSFFSTTFVSAFRRTLRQIHVLNCFCRKKMFRSDTRATKEAPFGEKRASGSEAPQVQNAGATAKTSPDPVPRNTVLCASAFGGGSGGPSLP